MGKLTSTIGIPIKLLNEAQVRYNAGVQIQNISNIIL